MIPFWSSIPLVAAVKIFSNSRGTDGKCVGWISARFARIFAGSRSQYAIVAPASIEAIWVMRARTCASGRNMNTVWVSSNRIRRRYISIVEMTLPWLSMQPFGGPVVPDV